MFCHRWNLWMSRVTCKLGLGASSGPFAWKKVPVRTTDIKRACYQVQKREVLPESSELLSHFCLYWVQFSQFFLFFLFFIFAVRLCQSVWIDHVSTCFSGWIFSSSHHCCVFEVSGFEVWSHSCMTNAGAAAVHLYACWRRARCPGPNGLSLRSLYSGSQSLLKLVACRDGVERIGSCCLPYFGRKHDYIINNMCFWHKRITVEWLV